MLLKSFNQTSYGLNWQGIIIRTSEVVASFNTLLGQEALVAHFDINVDGTLKTDTIMPMKDTLRIKGNLPNKNVSFQKY